MPDHATYDPESLWLSAHIAVQCLTIYDSVLDAVIVTQVAPLVRSLLDAHLIYGFFFVRYSAGGHHLRLRLLVNSRTSDDVRALVEESILPSKAGHTRSSADCESRVVERLTWVPYEPEVTRYGGPHALVVAEDLFTDSSTVAIAILASSRPGRDARLGKGALAMLVLAHVFARRTETVSEFLARYRAAYLPRLVRRRGGQLQDWAANFDDCYQQQAHQLKPYVEEAWWRLQEGVSLGAPFDEYYRRTAARRDALAGLIDQHKCFVEQPQRPTWRDCIARLLPSYVHMMSNRLGIEPTEESFIAHVLKRSIDDLSVISPECSV